MKSKLEDRSQRLTEFFWVLAQQRFVRVVAMAAVVLALVLSASPIEGLEPKLAAKALEISDIGLLPAMDSDLRGTDPLYRFRTVSQQLQNRITEKKIADPKVVAHVSNSLATVVANVRLPSDVETAAQLALAYLQSYQSLSVIGAADPALLQGGAQGPVVIGKGMDKTQFVVTPDFSGEAFTAADSNPRFFSDFTVMSFGQGPGRPIPQFVVCKSDESIAAVFNNIRIAGLAQDIGNFTWTNVVFQGCLIRYHGQPLRMGNVRFINCSFEYSPHGGDLLRSISEHQERPVSIYVPLENRRFH